MGNAKKKKKRGQKERQKQLPGRAKTPLGYCGSLPTDLTQLPAETIRLRASQGQCIKLKMRSEYLQLYSESSSEVEGEDANAHGAWHGI